MTGEGFLVPVDSVERAAGLVFFSEEAKEATKGLCEMTRCEVVRRFFDESGNISVLEVPPPPPPPPKTTQEEVNKV